MYRKIFHCSTRTTSHCDSKFLKVCPLTSNIKTEAINRSCVAVMRGMLVVRHIEIEAIHRSCDSSERHAGDVQH